MNINDIQIGDIFHLKTFLHGISESTVICTSIDYEKQIINFDDETFLRNITNSFYKEVGFKYEHTRIIRRPKYKTEILNNKIIVSLKISRNSETIIEEDYENVQEC